MDVSIKIRILEFNILKVENIATLKVVTIKYYPILLTIECIL